MEHRDTGRVHDKLINRIERLEKQQAFQRERFLRFKLPEIHRKLSQTLLMEKIIESENPAAVSEAVLKGLKKALNSSEFDHNYFVAPIRDLVSRANPYSLYMTQYIMEIIINDPNVIDIYGTDLEIYRTVNRVFSQVEIQFDRAEEEVKAQLARNKSLVPGSREYEIELDLMIRRKIGEPQKQ